MKPRARILVLLWAPFESRGCLNPHLFFKIIEEDSPSFG